MAGCCSKNSALIGRLFAIAISGYGTGNDQRKSLAVGYNSHLVKPFLPNTLLSLLEQAAEEKGSAPVG